MLRTSRLILGLGLLAVSWQPLLAQDDAPALVATHYFYWYDWPGEHFNEPGAPGREGHRRHFATPEKVSYRSIDWHEANFVAMAEASIDVALPVYWGAPGAYERPNLRFSRLGLAPMVAALDRLTARQEPAPRLGLFYDTSTLANDVRGAAPAGGKADLTTDAGRELFCTTITDYFAAIPAHYWARHRGGALVVLYVSGFAASWDAHLGDALRQAFSQRFEGESVCLVADASWGDIGQDLTTSWGAALWGPRLYPGVAQIGPGYDDRAVPGRRTPVRERENGAFYRYSWQQLLRHRPELVLLETWNEMHEGTELCPTREGGRQYVRLTRAWVRKLHAGDDGGKSVELRWPEPRVQPDLSWGKEAKGRDEVAACYVAYTSPAGLPLGGLRAISWEDGPCHEGFDLLHAGASPGGLGSYLYFQVSDHFFFDGDGDFELVVCFASPEKPGPWPSLEYDSRDQAATLAGAYTPSDGVPVDASAPDVRRYRLSHARFANRQNGGADFRLVLPRRAASIQSITLTRL